MTNNQSRKRRLYVFHHIEKCAGTTLILLLRRSLGIRHCDIIPIHDSDYVENADVARALKTHPSLISIAGHSFRPYMAETLFSSVAETHDISWYTILRDPVQRYISLYFHFVNKLGYSQPFEAWAEDGYWHNWLTKSIAGDPDSEKAIAILQSRFNVVGFVDDYDGFMARFKDMMQPTLLLPEYEIVNQRGLKFGKIHGARSNQKLTDREIEIAKDVNSADVEFYANARQAYAPQTVPAQLSPDTASLIEPAWKTKLRYYYCLGYRNLIYKPLTSKPPFTAYMLPRYAQIYTGK